jgi:protein SCO1/2
MSRTFVLALLIVAACFTPPEQQQPQQDLVLLEPQNVELVDQDGRPFRLESVKGKRAMLFFGYTRCPDACPMTLSKLASAYALLGEKGNDIETLFVSVDPRDKPEDIKQYLSYFTAIPATGLSGSKEQIDHAVKQFAATYEIVDSGSAAGPVVNHTTSVFLVDPDGKVRKTFSFPETAEEIAKALR